MTMTLEDSKDIDQRIDGRLALLRDSVELKLTKEVDSILKSRFESTGKLLSLAFGLVALVFTGLGIKTLLDVKDVARNTAIEEVKKKLAIDDPNSEFRRDIDKIVARGLIDSYLLTLAKSKNERFGANLAISESDLRRLRALITDERTSEKDFSDAIEVLLQSAAHGRDESIDRLIQDLASGTDDRYKWLPQQPAKLAALLRLYTGDKLIDRSSAILAEAKAPKALLTAAIKYSGTRDIQSASLLAKLSGHADSEIANEAALALARISPESEELKKVLNFALKSSDDTEVARAIRLAIELAKPSRQSNFLRKDSNLSRRREASADVIMDAIRLGFYFRLSSNFGDRKSTSLYVSSINRPSTFYGISSDLLRGSSQGALDSLFASASKEPASLLRVVRAFCLDEDEKCWGLVRLDLGKDGRVSLEGGQELDSVKAPAGVTLRPESAKPDTPIWVTWTDADAVVKRGKLAAIQEATKIKYSVAVSKTISRVDDDE
jgi:hypothetical protein